MILVTRLNGAVFALNPDLVERADCTPDTVITLVSGEKILVRENAEQVMERIIEFRRSILRGVWPSLSVAVAAPSASEVEAQAAP